MPYHDLLAAGFCGYSSLARDVATMKIT